MFDGCFLTVFYIIIEHLYNLWLTKKKPNWVCYSLICLFIFPIYGWSITCLWNIMQGPEPGCSKFNKRSYYFSHPSILKLTNFFSFSLFTEFLSQRLLLLSCSQGPSFSDTQFYKPAKNIYTLEKTHSFCFSIRRVKSNL